MELEQVRLQTTWNDAAGSINNNYAKIADAIAQLKADGGGGGSGADIDLTDYATKVWVEAKGYITASALTPYLKTDDAEDTYATKDFVDNKLVDYAPLTSVQGFENRIGGLEGAVPRLNARVETVESKVATLNEYVVTGGNNLLNRVNVIEQEYATKTYVDNAIDGIDLSAYLLKADLTKSRIQSTLGISDWALASATPTIKKERLTNLDSGNPWTAFYTSFQPSNRPDGANYFTGFTLTNVDYQGQDDTYQIQLAISHTGTLHTRYRSRGSFNAWNTLAFTSDIPTRLSQLTDDVVAGKYLPLSGGTMVGGFAIKADASNSATILFSPNNAAVNHWLGVNSAGVLWFSNNGWSQQYDILHSGNIGNYKSGDSDKLGGYGLTSFLLMTGRDYTEMDLNTIGGSQSIFTEIRTTEVTTTNSPYEGYGTLLSLKDRSGIAKMQFLGSCDSSVLYFRSQQKAGADITSAWKTIAFTDSNVASATKLKTRCKLWGNGFDGTANIGGDITLDAYQDGRQLSIQQTGGIKFSTPPTNGWATSLDIYANDKTTLLTSAFGVYGTGEYVRYAFIGGTYDNPNVVVKDDSGYVGIGTTSPTEKLDVAGNVKASGNIKATSITINGVTITASNGTITVNGNVFATGAITAKV